MPSAKSATNAQAPSRLIDARIREQTRQAGLSGASRLQAEGPRFAGARNLRSMTAPPIVSARPPPR